MKLIRKKYMIIFLLLGIFFASVISVNTVFAQGSNSESEDSTVEDIYIGDFNLYTYRADVYLEEGTPCHYVIEDMMTKTIFFPSQRVVDFLDVKKTFQKKVTAWEHSHYVTSPSELVEGGIDEIGYYEAIILSIFASLEENEDYLLDCANKVTAESNQVFSFQTAERVFPVRTISPRSFSASRR